MCSICPLAGCFAAMSRALSSISPSYRRSPYRRRPAQKDVDSEDGAAWLAKWQQLAEDETDPYQPRFMRGRPSPGSKLPAPSSFANLGLRERVPGIHLDGVQDIRS
jgi:hypothetical protein